MASRAVGGADDVPPAPTHLPARPGFEVVPFAPAQRQGVDWLGLMQRQHTVHALLEVDVTDARQAIRDYRARTGQALSFTAFIVACLARAIDDDRRLHALRKGRSALVLFDEVDVTVLVETDVDDAKVPMPHIVRAANRRTAAEITHLIRDAQAGDAPYAASRRWLPLWFLVPAPIRQFVWARILADPRRRKRLTGTVAVTAVGMFGQGIGWAIPLTNYPLCLSVGGIARRPAVVRGEAGPGGRAERIEVREQLALTMSFDHDLINGAPAARFAKRLKELIESGAGLVEPEGDGTAPSLGRVAAP
jgi:pyruvate/2-oxoglutarate dehydrogenase complex dihydrolipoamide acyltransferase (E2) component